MFRIPGIPSTMRAFCDGWRRVARHAVAALQKEPDMTDTSASPPPEPAPPRRRSVWRTLALPAAVDAAERERVLDLFRTED